MNDEFCEDEVNKKLCREREIVWYRSDCTWMLPLPILRVIDWYNNHSLLVHNLSCFVVCKHRQNLQIQLRKGLWVERTEHSEMNWREKIDLETYTTDKLDSDLWIPMIYNVPNGISMKVKLIMPEKFRNWLCNYLLLGRYVFAPMSIFVKKSLDIFIDLINNVDLFKPVYLYNLFVTFLSDSNYLSDTVTDYSS
jgi:hypothetical protein